MYHLLSIIYSVGSHTIEDFIAEKQRSLHILRDRSLHIMEDKLITQYHLLEIDHHIFDDTPICDLAIQSPYDILLREQSL